MLTSIIAGNSVLWKVLQDVSKVALEHYYIGGGCVAQTV